MDYLFQVSIGPVQPFIASARRTRDLWFGSHLLSELSRTTAQTIQDNHGHLIFPAFHEQKTYSVANKVLAVITVPDAEIAPAEYLHMLGTQVRTEIDKHLHKLLDQILAYTAIQDNINEKMTRDQIDDLVELNWVALPLKQPQSYGETRKRLEALMSARKNIRNFRPAPSQQLHQVPWPADHHKSSISGELEAVIKPSLYPPPLPRKSDAKLRQEIMRKRERMAQYLYRTLKVNPTERLSGVDLFKRLRSEQEGKVVLSTSHVAALSYLQRLERLNAEQQTEAKASLWKYIEQARKIAELDTVHLKRQDNATFEPFNSSILRNDAAQGQLLDGAIFFPERLLDKDPDASSNAAFKSATKLLDDFFHYVDSCLRNRDVWHSGARPSPYYAMLKADGDSMGNVIDTLAKQANGLEQHQKLSGALDSFAASVEKHVHEHQGLLIYAGGDDVLALLPLHTVVDCAYQLADEFRSKLDKFKIDGLTPSLSVGIAIVHHLELLDEARELVGMAEHKAKDVKGKNALAITLSKRSGETYTIADQWGKLDATLQKLIDYCYQQIIPTGMAYELRDSAQRLGTALPEVLLSDVKRIIHRKLFVPQPKDKRMAQEAELFLWQQLGIADDGSVAPSESPVDIDQFAHKLIIAQMLADAKRVAMVEVQPVMKESNR